MKTNYVLIDYENVQPRNIAILKNHPFKVVVFVGANQTKIPFELAEALHGNGDGNGDGFIFAHTSLSLPGK
ncbi:MAG: hypothetical protein D3919_13250 [Candidatus Electrothrix sp. AW5]|nr:hypothetical protein [Candidatus Electrothrix gigas]